MLAQVHPADLGVVHNLGRRALRQHPAIADDESVVANAQRFAHVVSVISTPMPRAFKKPTMRWISITAIGSMPANGSSSKIKRGCVASARAISTRRRSPPDSASAGESRKWSTRSSCSSAVRRSSMAALGRGFPASSRCNSSTARTFSCTVSLRKIDASCGKYDSPKRERR